MRRLSLVVCLVACSCQTTPPVAEDVLAQLRDHPDSYLSGAPKDVGAPEIVNRRDFIWALAFDDTSTQLAFAHHVTTEMEVTLTGIEPIAPVFQSKLNRSEFDLEDVVFDGDRLLVPSRQGILRSLDRKTGAILQEVSLGEPLLRVAKNSTHVFVATSYGRVVIFDRALRFIGEAVLHDEEIRGLLALDDGRVVTASMDGTLKIGRVQPEHRSLVRVPVASLKTGEQVFVGHLGGTRAISIVRDARQPTTSISRAAVKRLELPSAFGEARVITPEGEQAVPMVQLGELRLRALGVGEIAAGVCDACVPRGAELVLGQDVLSRLSLVEDVARGELVAKAQEGAEGVSLADGAQQVSVLHEVALPGSANDLHLSKAGIAVVTFSHDKAERSYEVHEAERKGDYPPPSPKSGAALINLNDVDKASLGAQFVNQHLGFAVTGSLSPDGKTLVTGGWDKRVLVWDVATGKVVTERSFAWSIRRVRISPNGRLLGVGAWTPVNALNEGDSEPAMVLYPLVLAAPVVVK